MADKVVCTCGEAKCNNRIYVEKTNHGSYRLFAEREGHTVLLYVTLRQMIDLVISMIFMRKI